MATRGPSPVSSTGCPFQARSRIRPPAGMACAADMAKAGCDVTVLEQGVEPGGCVWTDRHASGVLVERGAFEHGGVLPVAEELGLTDPVLGAARLEYREHPVAAGFVFGDAFINTLAAGQLYFETLNFHNPTSTDSTIAIRLLFSNSDVVTVNVSVPARGFSELKLHELPEIIVDRRRPTPPSGPTGWLGRVHGDVAPLEQPMAFQPEFLNGRLMALAGST